MEEFGVIFNSGKNVCMKGFVAYELEKITAEELKEIQEDFEPIEAPPGPYKVQPDKQGI